MTPPAFTRSQNSNLRLKDSFTRIKVSPINEVLPRKSQPEEVFIVNIA